MAPARLSTLDASFLAVESETAHMHVGWIASFAPPAGRQAPGFEELREHIAARLPRARRYRQRLVPMPLGLSTPAWIDDPDFDIDRHVIRSDELRLPDAVARTMSEPLAHDRPLWQITIADRLADGRIGVVGKAHHCMVDGIAAVELAALLVDPDPDAADPEPTDWEPEPPPPTARLLLDGARQGVTDRLGFALGPLAGLRSPSVSAIRRRIGGTARASVDALRPAPAPAGPLNARLSPKRHVGTVCRPLETLKRVKSAHGTTVNDVLLAAVAGGLRRYHCGLGAEPVRLKTMVPVNVRPDGESGGPGNRLTFMFVDLPCDEPDPLRRLRDVHLETSARKQSGVPEGAELLLEAAARLPHLAHGAIARALARPGAFNLVVSNIPGPTEPLYMRGCRLEEAYPVVPLAEHHALSVGMTTIGEHACFGLYADQRSLPDVDELASAIDRSIEELLATVPSHGPEPPRPRSGGLRGRGARRGDPHLVPVSMG